MPIEEAPALQPHGCDKDNGKWELFIIGPPVSASFEVDEKQYTIPFIGNKLFNNTDITIPAGTPIFINYGTSR